MQIWGMLLYWMKIWYGASLKWGIFVLALLNTALRQFRTAKLFNRVKKQYFMDKIIIRGAREHPEVKRFAFTTGQVISKHGKHNNTWS
jgi:hypothetical protein